MSDRHSVQSSSRAHPNLATATTLIEYMVALFPPNDRRFPGALVHQSPRCFVLRLPRQQPLWSLPPVYMAHVDSGPVRGTLIWLNTFWGLYVVCVPRAPR
jgi:hypothetical protein